MIYPSSIQVTNPAIDPLREGLVMSLEVNIGKRRNILEVGPENASQVFFIWKMFYLRSYTRWFLLTLVWLSNICPSTYTYLSIAFVKVFLSSPVLNEGELESLMKDSNLKPKVLPTFFDIRKGLDGSLERMLKRLCEAADEAVRSGSQLLVLSDRSEELVCIRFLFLYITLAKN